MSVVKMGKAMRIAIAAFAVLAAIAFLLVFKGERIEEGRCRLVRKQTGSLMELASQVVEPQTSKPDSVRDLPAGFDRPCYYLINSAGRQIPLVVDLTARPSLCVDSKGDGVLSQERRFAGACIHPPKGGADWWRFGPVSFVPESEAGEADSRFYVMTSEGSDGTYPLVLYPASYRTGTLSLAGQAYRVAVVDVDHDGRFCSTLSLPLGMKWRIPGCDTFAIDLDHDGKFGFTRYDQSEVMPLGRMVSVAGSYYAIDIAADGTSLSLSKTEPQFGTLAIEPNDTFVCLRLWSDAADQYLPTGTQWQLPAGRYKAVNATTIKWDSSGTKWTFMARVSESSVYGYVHLGPLDFFEIAPGKTTTIKIGPPFVVKTIVEQAGQGSVLINAALMDSAGVEYAMDFRRDDRPAPKHAFKIIDEQGNVLIADTFAYG